LYGPQKKKWGPTVKTFLKWGAVIAAAVILVIPQDMKAGIVGMSRASLAPVAQHIAFHRPTLAPMAYTQFCLRYSDQCKTQKLIFRGGPVRLTEQRVLELNEVNDSVNSSIIPERNYAGVAAEKWLIAPSNGDCNDYAVTKRSALLALGWPSRALLLSEVITPSGEHHLILVVRTRDGDLVLDNMTSSLRLWSKVPYQWVRMQTPSNPNFWAAISGATHNFGRIKVVLRAEHSLTSVD
jgi:predicted transglutaminase-like cysteine proteinase